LEIVNWKLFFLEVSNAKPKLGRLNQWPKQTIISKLRPPF
jgi:hypothetical protein